MSPHANCLHLVQCNMKAQAENDALTTTLRFLPPVRGLAAVYDEKRPVDEACCIRTEMHCPDSAQRVRFRLTMIH